MTIDKVLSPKSWWVYVIVSHSGRTYVGSTVDPLRRLKQHNGEIPGGAKSTRAHKPWSLGRVYGPYQNRSEAFKAEISLKRGKRSLCRLKWSETDSNRFCDSDAAQAWTKKKDEISLNMCSISAK